MPDPSITTILRARDFMQTDVLTVSPETSIIDIHKLFIQEEIHGAPVVDERGAVRGVVSTLDLLRAVTEQLEPNQAAAYFRGEQWVTVDELPARLRDVTAFDVMTPQLVAVPPDMPIADVATQMRVHHIHRVLVIEHHELLGVLTTFDLLAHSFLSRAGLTRFTGVCE